MVMVNFSHLHAMIGWRNFKVTPLPTSSSETSSISFRKGARDKTFASTNTLENRLNEELPGFTYLNGHCGLFCDQPNQSSGFQGWFVHLPAFETRGRRARGGPVGRKQAQVPGANKPG